MMNARRNGSIEPRDTILWQGARQVLDHSQQRRGRDAFAFAMKVNKGTRT
jgi:hypothetical protein